MKLFQLLVITLTISACASRPMSNIETHTYFNEFMLQFATNCLKTASVANTENSSKLRPYLTTCYKKVTYEEMGEAFPFTFFGGRGDFRKFITDLYKPIGYSDADSGTFGHYKKFLLADGLSTIRLYFFAGRKHEYGRFHYDDEQSYMKITAKLYSKDIMADFENFVGGIKYPLSEVDLLTQQKLKSMKWSAKYTQKRSYKAQRHTEKYNKRSGKKYDKDERNSQFIYNPNENVAPTNTTGYTQKSTTINSASSTGISACSSNGNGSYCVLEGPSSGQQCGNNTNIVPTSAQLCGSGSSTTNWSRTSCSCGTITGRTGRYCKVNYRYSCKAGPGKSSNPKAKQQ